MDLPFKRSVMGTALATVIMVTFLKCNLVLGQALDYNWCLYRYYSQSLSWAAASLVCEQKGLKLAVMTEQASYDFVTNLIKDTAKAICPDVQNSMWIGLHKDHAGNVRNGDCKLYTAKDFNPTQNLDKSCVYLDAGSTTFKADECDKPMPFLCQHEALDLQKCYDRKTLPESKLAEINGPHKRDTVEECSDLCYNDCFGFKFDTGVNECTLMSYTADPVPGYSTEPHYTKALLDIEPYEMEATIEPVDLCTSAVAAGGPNNAVTTNVDAPDVTSSNTLQSSNGAVVDATTDTANPSSSDLDLQGACSSHDSVRLESTCFCSCEEKEKNQPTETPEELKAELLVNRKDLSSWKRTLTSAPDQRMSAKGIGLFGVAILIALGIAVLILDLPALIGEHQRLMERFKKCRNIKHRTVNKTRDRNDESV